MTNPLWRKAPLVLLRFPALLASVAAATALLALAVASGPLFVSSAASSALADELGDATAFGAGASVFYQPVGERVHPLEPDMNAGIERLGASLAPALRGVSHLDAPVLTVLGATVYPRSLSGSSAQPVRLLAKTDALDHVATIAGRDGDGVWIADETAETLGLQPGDDLELEYDDGAVRMVYVDGIYRALWKEPRTPYWRSLSRDIYASDPDLGPPPTFLIVDQEQIAALSPESAGLQLRWEWPLDSTTLTLDDAEELERRLRLFQQRAEGLATRLRVTPDCQGCPAFRAPEVEYSSLLPIAISAANERVATLRGPADFLTGAGTLVAIAVVAAAAAFTLARRRIEAAVLFARGASPSTVGMRAAVEALLPILVGALAGLALAIGLTAVAGPGAVDRPALVSAATGAALVVPGAALIVGVMSALVYALSREQQGALHIRLARIPWELPVLTAAGFLLYELWTNGAFTDAGEDGVGRPSAAVILFPLLLTAGVGGIAARALRRAFGGLRAVSARFPAGPYLAVCRLAAAGGLAMLLTTASAVALGTFVYAQTVVRSLNETVEAKSLLFVGSDVQGRTDYTREIPGDFPLPATKVTKLVERGELDRVNVDVLAIDPSTFPSAAYFDDSWADEPLVEVVSKLTRADDDRLPVVLAGGSSTASSLVIGGADIPIEVVAETVAFPGMSIRRTLVVVGRAAFERAMDRLGAGNALNQAGAETEVWVRGDPAEAERALAASPLRPFPIVTAEQVRENPHIRAVTQTFSYLEALGLAAGLLAVAGAVLYLQARQRNRVVAYALAARMGLTPGRHRLALGLELGSLLLAAFAVGACLAVVASRLVVVELDAPAPLPGGPLFRTPWPLIVGALAGLVAATLLGALLAHRRAQRANVVEVIRAAE